MAHIYVSSVHGQNTGASDASFLNQQTGAMTSLTDTDVYDNIGSAIAGASPSSGDTIYVADNHNASYDNGIAVTIPAGVHTISVDASNIENYKPGASEHLSDDVDDYNFGNGCLVAGIDLETGDNVVQSSSAGGCYVQDCTLTVDSTGDYAVANSNTDGHTVTLTNVDVSASVVMAVALYVANGSHVYWNGGTLNSSITSLIALGGNGGSNIYINGVDISNATNIVQSVVSEDDNFIIRLTNCTLNSSVVLPSGYSYLGQRFEMYNCDDTAGVFHRFYIADYAGTAQNNDSTYVTATESWYEGSDKSSIEVTTTANCSHGAPFIFELPAQYVDLAKHDKRRLAIDLVTDSTAVSLTDTDIAAFLCYPDGTTAVQANWITTGKTVGAGNYGVDPLATGTALTNVGGLTADDWNEPPTSANYYRLELNTGVDKGQATIVKVRIEIYTNNGGSGIASGDLFINPRLTVY
jgi:hypothetical protein